jgi:ADP-ribose pyrophosphatase YjhB (NUDIX family)
VSPKVDFHQDQNLRENIRVGVIVLTLQKVLLIERFKSNRHYWAFPGGHKRKGEKLVETAIRELAEETSIKAEEKELTKILDYFNSHSRQREVFYLLTLRNPYRQKSLVRKKQKPFLIIPIGQSNIL